MKWVYLIIGFTVTYILTSVVLNGAHPFSILISSIMIFFTLWITLRYAALTGGAYSAPIPALPGEANLIYNARNDLIDVNYILAQRLNECNDDKSALQAKVLLNENIGLPNYAYDFNPRRENRSLQKGKRPTYNTQDRREYWYDKAAQAGDVVGAIGGVGLGAAKAVGGYGLGVAENVAGDVWNVAVDAGRQKAGLGAKNGGRKGKKGGKNEHIGKGKGGAHNMGIKNDGKAARPVGRPKKKKPPDDGKPKKKGRPGPKPKNSNGDVMVYDPDLKKYVTP